MTNVPLGRDCYSVALQCVCLLRFSHSVNRHSLGLAPLRSLAREFNHISTGIINSSHKTYVRHIVLCAPPT